MEAIILAAGFSSRANAFKMTLPLGEKTVLEHTLSKFEGICRRIIVVVGFEAKKIEAQLADIFATNTYSFEVKIVYNEHFELGMFSSIQVGCKELTVQAFFMTPGDCPLVKKETVELLAKQQGDIVIPSFNYKGGHPIKLSRTLMQQILKTHPESNLREILHQYEKTYINVEDPGVIMDVDTPDDYHRALEYFREHNRS